MKKAQVTIEFLMSFLFYLVFLSTILLALSAYSHSVKETVYHYSKVAGMAGDSASFESFQTIRRFNLLEMENREYKFEDGLIVLRENRNIVIDVIDQGGMDYEPV